MTKMHICLKGVRGSIPIHGEDFVKYGGATSCVFAEVGGEIFILDAGSGLRCKDFAEFTDTERFTLLISHAHVDHLIGFPMLSALFDKSRSVSVYLKTRAQLDARSQLEALMSPPLWPIGTDSIRAELEFYDVVPEFNVGEVRIETFEVSHPGGCTAYKLSFGGVSFVYATDFEPREDESDFVSFASGCDLLLLDAQYTDSEYTRTCGFGHSTVSRSIALSERIGAKKTIFIHHDPNRRDDVLTCWDAELSKQHPTIHFGREDEEVFL